MKKPAHSFDSEWLPLDRASSLNADKKAILLVQETRFIGSEYLSQIQTKKNKKQRRETLTNLKS